MIKKGRERGNEIDKRSKNEKMKQVEFRIGFKINVDLLHNSIAFSFESKVKGKRKVRKKVNKGRRISNQIIQHIHRVQN